MRVRPFVQAATLTAALAAPALADMPPTPRPTSPPTTQETPEVRDPGQPPTPRQEAEQTYALAFQEVEKGKKDLAANKQKNADKKFRRAKERCERAVQLDPKYYEAWNIVGFTSRMLGDFDGALKAYDRCLELNPDYAPAREYLGEAYLERGQVEIAREQLAHLEKLKAEEYAERLRKAIEAWEKTPPDSTGKRRFRYGGS